MRGFSTVDGFVEINESLGEMIKFVANEPSVGLFYIQQHTQNVVPHVITLKNNIAQKAHETNLHNQDSEDSITMVSSMKEYGVPIVQDMVKDIKKSLDIISSKKLRKGLNRNTSSGFLIGQTSSWGPAMWGRTTVDLEPDGKEKDGYFSKVLKSAKQKVNWAQPDSIVAGSGSGSHMLNNEFELLNQNPVDGQNLLLESEDYDEFKANREAKLNEWLEGEKGKEANDGEN